MQLPLSPCARDHAIVADPTFWLRDLRLGRYAELAATIANPAYRADRLAKAFPLRRHLVYLADRLRVPQHRDSDALRAALVAAGEDLLPYLAVAAFAPHKDEAAVLDAARHALPPDLVEASRGRSGRHDRLLLILCNPRPVPSRRPAANM
jgi:hypothetical protein